MSLNYPTAGLARPLRGRWARASRGTLAATAAVATVLGLFAGPAAQAASGNSGIERKAPLIFSASAWGSHVKALGGVLGSGKTAAVGIGCTSKIGIERENSVAGVDIGELAHVGAVTSTATTAKDGKTYTAQANNHVADASLLGGTVEVTGIDTTATVTRNKKGYHSDVAFAIASVKVGGEEVELGGETQVIEIPGVATLTIAGEKTKEKKKSGSATGTAIKLDLLDGTATIRIGHASAGLDESLVDGLLAGGAYSAKVEVGGVVQAGKTAKKSLPCLGTNGKEKSSTTAEVEIGDLVTVGASSATVMGTTGDDAEARTSSEIASVDISVLGVATLRLTGIRGEIHAVRNPDGTISTDLGESTIGKIEVVPLIGGPIEVPIPVDPNTVIDLPLDLGTIGFLMTSPYKGDKGLMIDAAVIDIPLLGINVHLANARAAIK